MNALKAFAFATTFALAAPGAMAGDAGQAGRGPGLQDEAALQMSEGEIRNVQKESAKMTIRHGELKNLGMPAMTMVFRVKDPAMLDQVKAGERVKFVAEKVGGALTVVRLEKAR